jgi:hypothetical protein
LTASDGCILGHGVTLVLSNISLPHQRLYFRRKTLCIKI